MNTTGLYGTALALCLVVLPPPGLAHRIYLEAEHMADSTGRPLFQKGGWVIDPQAMDIMGSPYLLAHGIGTPVRDVFCSVDIPRDGDYRFWVRTRDWVPPHGAGRFELLVSGSKLDSVFGVRGDGSWMWQNGGVVSLSAGTVEVRLHDLTGFEGRCDAIVITDELAYVPPSEAGARRSMRETVLGIDEPILDTTVFDFVVVGGGLAGCCAVHAAADASLKVALINNRPRLGGNSAFGVPVAGFEDDSLFPRNTDYRSNSRYLGPHDNISVFHNTHVNGVEKTGATIQAVIGQGIPSGRKTRFRAPLFLDATGDGAVGFLADAEYRMGRESYAQTGEAHAPDEPDSLHLGSTIYWKMSEQDTPSPFPVLPWAIQIADCREDVAITGGNWTWQTGQYRNQIAEIETIRDHFMRAVYGVFSHLKNDPATSAEYANYRLEYFHNLIAPRESRRLVGDIVFSETDITNRVRFPDACVLSDWFIEAHAYLPNSLDKLECIRADTTEEPYRIHHLNWGWKKFGIPFRSLYSKDIDNLFMAGRDISATHSAMLQTRVQGTGAMTGTAVGRAAYLCRKLNIKPRQVYTDHLEEFKSILSDPDNLSPVAAAQGLQEPPSRTELAVALPGVPLVRMSLPEGSLSGPIHVTIHSIDGRVVRSAWTNSENPTSPTWVRDQRGGEEGRPARGMYLCRLYSRGFLNASKLLFVK